MAFGPHRCTETGQTMCAASYASTRLWLSTATFQWYSSRCVRVARLLSICSSSLWARRDDQRCSCLYRRHPSVSTVHLSTCIPVRSFVRPLQLASAQGLTHQGGHLGCETKAIASRFRRDELVAAAPLHRVSLYSSDLPSAHRAQPQYPCTALSCGRSPVAATMPCRMTGTHGVPPSTAIGDGTEAAAASSRRLGRAPSSRSCTGGTCRLHPSHQREHGHKVRQPDLCFLSEARSSLAALLALFCLARCAGATSSHRLERPVTSPIDCRVSVRCRDHAVRDRKRRLTTAFLSSPYAQRASIARDLRDAGAPDRSVRTPSCQLCCLIDLLVSHSLQPHRLNFSTRPLLARHRDAVPIPRELFLTLTTRYGLLRLLQQTAVAVGRSSSRATDAASAALFRRPDALWRVTSDHRPPRLAHGASENADAVVLGLRLRRPDRV